MANNLSETTITIASVIQFASPIAVAVIGGASWTIKRIIGKLEDNLEKLNANLEKLDERCKKAEERIRKEREESIKTMALEMNTMESELYKQMAELESECKQCRDRRIQEHTDCVDTYGKFGARLTGLEREHALNHRGGASCPPAV